MVPLAQFFTQLPPSSTARASCRRHARHALGAAPMHFALYVTSIKRATKRSRAPYHYCRRFRATAPLRHYGFQRHLHFAAPPRIFREASVSSPHEMMPYMRSFIAEYIDIIHTSSYTRPDYISRCYLMPQARSADVASPHTRAYCRSPDHQRIARRARRRFHANTYLHHFRHDSLAPVSVSFFYDASFCMPS